MDSPSKCFGKLTLPVPEKYSTCAVTKVTDTNGIRKIALRAFTAAAHPYFAHSVGGCNPTGRKLYLLHILHGREPLTDHTVMISFDFLSTTASTSLIYLSVSFCTLS